MRLRFESTRDAYLTVLNVLSDDRVVLLLPKELQQGLLVLRDLEAGQEERIPEEEFLADPGRFL